MYIDRDAKIILIYSSIMGIIWFVILYFIIVSYQKNNPNENFNLIQIIIFGILSILVLILTGNFLSLKKEISTQNKYLETQLRPTDFKEKYVKVPYNKSGLYSLIIASSLGIVAFLYIYSSLVLQTQEYYNQNIGLFSTMVFIFVTIFIIILLVSFFILLKRIKTPLHYTFKECPRCKSIDIHKVEYSWWGGLIGPYLVHQVRCKNCGKTYNGFTGTNVSSSKIFIYVIMMITISSMLLVLKFII